jgi:hypothetical protein
MAAAPRPTPAPLSPTPRQGTKIAGVIALLQRDQGAKLDELIAATGWLPHTARAALTGRASGADWPAKSPATTIRLPATWSSGAA